MRVDHKQRIERAFAFRPIPTQNLPAWCDSHRHLAASSGAISGAWRTARFEIARGPMMAMSERGVRTITCKVATQTLKTELVNNVLAFHICESPCPILLVLPKEDSVRSYSKERFAPMVRATPALRAVLGDVMRDKSLEALNFKQFPGGFLAMESAGSPTNLASRPIRLTLCDEVDKYSDTAEGDALLLAEERTSTFPDALHIRCSSPTIDGESRIDKSYQDGDQRRAFVKCPHCRREQTMEFFKSPTGAHVDWNKSEDGEHFPNTAALYCEECGSEWSEAQRLQLVTTAHAIRWQQTRPFTCCNVRQEPLKTRKWDWDDEAQCGYATCTECNKRAVPNHHASFTASKLYSPVITVPELASKWIECKDEIASKQMFVNTQLGLTFSAQTGRRVETHSLAARREAFGDVIPPAVIRLTCGVDSQGDRLEAHIVGWGHPEEAWSIHYEIFPGDPAKAELWERLDEFLASSFPHAYGAMRISATCVDSGGQHTEMCYRFCQPRAARNVWAIKGSSWSKRGDPVWPVPKTRKTRDWGYKPVVIAVDSAKDHIRQMLFTDEPGPGYFHIPAERSDAWLEQMTAEQPVYEKKGGVMVRKWMLPRGRANESFDTTVYAFAALCGLKSVRGLKMERAAADMLRYGKVTTNERESV
jgi:phage terminase large subunit GpA-like protein